MKATGGAAPYTVTDTDDRRGAGRHLERPGAEHGALPLQPTTRCATSSSTAARSRRCRAWGIAGGGPMNDQQIDTIIAYLEDIQLPAEKCPSGVNHLRGRHTAQGEAGRDPEGASTPRSADGSAKSEGEAIFNLTLDSGAYSCARCHTNGWSYGNPLVSGGGALGPNLTGGGEVRQFPNAEDNLSFVQAPPEQGQEVRPAGPVDGPHAGVRLVLQRRAAGRPHRTTSGACDAEPRNPARHQLAARDPRHLRRRHRRHRAHGQRLPDPHHQPRLPPRLPGRAGRPLRLADADGRSSGWSTASV